MDSKDKKAPKAPNAWQNHVKAVRAKNPGKPLKEVMQEAAASYTKKEKAPKV
jgi:hypothetical protein